jgi:hypothetical protein
VFHLIARHQHPVKPLAHAADQLAPTAAPTPSAISTRQAKHTGLALAAAATPVLARWRDVCAAD